MRFIRFLRDRLALLAVLALLLVAGSLAAYKSWRLDYHLADILPRTLYRVTYHLRFDGQQQDLRIRTFLPQSTERQQVTEEKNDSPGLHLVTEMSGLNRAVVWTGDGVGDSARADYSFAVLTQAVRFEIDPTTPVAPLYPKSLSAYLRPEPDIQVDHREVKDALARIGADRGPLLDRVRRIHDFTAALTPRAFKGTTDALTALRLGEASCNGKSRLFVALARASGIPARLVGGLILQSGSKRTSHQWVEVYASGHWVPFCPTNHHFAALPANYLELYRGDEALFAHTADINFNYQFETKSTQIPSPKARTGFQFGNVWALFDRLGLPFSLLRTLLMLPIGALVVVLFRNVVGVPTFGTFLPALIAAAAAETGAAWGIFGVLMIVGVVAFVRFVMQRLQLLHSPTLAILLAAVTTTMLGTSLLAERWGVDALTRISLFPIAVLAITAERFYLSLAENGGRIAAQELAGTVLVILGCYVLMHSLALQVLVIGYPEVLLVVVALNIWLGRWTGVRISEYVRFRKLLLTRSA